MKAIYSSLLISFLCISCVAQNHSTRKEAREKINGLKKPLELTNSQAKKLINIETSYLKDSNRIAKYSNGQNYQLQNLKNKRVAEIKRLLSHEQFLKFDLIDNDRIKKTPIRIDQ